MSGEAIFGHFEVTRAKSTGEVPNKHGGTLDRYYVGLKNLDGGEGTDDAFWQRQHPSEVAVGDKVYGKLEKRSGDQGDRFFLEKEPDAPRGGGGSSEASTGSKAGEITYAYPPRPEVAARIGRAHAQGMAVDVCKAMGIFEGNSAEQIYSKLLGWISWFAADVDQAGKTASQAEGTTPPSQVGAAPLPDASPSPDSQAVQQVSEAFNAVPDDTAQYLDHILDNAGVMDPAERHHLVSAWEGLEPEDGRSAEQRRNAVVKGIETTDLEARAVALKRLREIAGPMSAPAGKPEEDDIPF